MGAGIAQVAATAGHPVALVDAATGAAEEAVARIIGSLRRLEAKGRLSSPQLEEVVERITTVDAVERLPQSGLVIEAVREDLGINATSSPASPRPSTPTRSWPRTPPAWTWRCGRHTRPCPRHRAPLLQPAPGDAPRRGGARGRVGAGVRRRRHRADARLGQDTGPVHLDARVHRQPRGAAVLRRGAADAHGGSGRRRHARRGPALGGLPDGSARAHRLHRPGRQPRRRHQRVGADGPRSSLRAHRAPAGSSSPPVTSAARAGKASTATRPMAQPSGSSRTSPASPSC